MPQMQYEDPMKSMIDGMLRGHAVASQIQHTKMQQEAMVRQAARDDREAGIQQIMTKMQLLDQGALEVDPSTGMVTESRPELRTGGTDLGAGVILPGSTVDGIQFARKAKAPVTLNGPNGRIQLELPSPERRSELRVSRSREGKTPIDLPGGQTAWVDPKEVPALQQTMLENAMVDTPGEYRGFGGPTQVPRKMLPQVQTVMNQILGRQEATERAAATAAATNQRAIDDRKSREKIADDTAKSRERVAGIKEGKAEARADARAAASDAKAATRLKESEDRQERTFIEQQHEPVLHSRRREIGEILTSGKDINGKDINDAVRGRLATEYKGLNDKVQNVQLRKAKLYGSKNPPTKETVQGAIAREAKLPADQRGQERLGPDGHYYKLEDGILYFVR